MTRDALLKNLDALTTDERMAMMKIATKLGLALGSADEAMATLEHALKPLIEQAVSQEEAANVAREKAAAELPGLSENMRRALLTAYCGTFKTSKGTGNALIKRGLAKAAFEAGRYHLTQAGSAAARALR